MAEPTAPTNRLKSTTKFKGAIRGVAYHWIRQDMKEGSSDNGNFSFVDTRLYSYDTQVAQLHQAKGGKVALFTTQRSFDGHVNTTNGKHINPAYNMALHGGDGMWCNEFKSKHAAAGIFHVPDFRLACKHEMNLEHFLELYQQACNAIARARVGKPLYYWVMNAPNNVMQQLVEYCTLFNIPRPEENYESIFNHAMDKRTEREIVYHSPKEVEKRLRKESRRMLKDLCLGKVNP